MRHHNAPTDPSVIFDLLVELMEADNCCHFTNTDEQRLRAVPHITALQTAGYFTDDPDNLDGSFWQAAAGEHTEVREFFSLAPGAYEGLDKILNEIFDTPKD